MEYAIWGIPAGDTEETLLLARRYGEPITSKIIAEDLAEMLRGGRFGSRAVRIQEIDLTTPPDFAGTINRG